MKARSTLTGLVLTTGVVHGQNLVQNGSFEEYTDCPDYFGLIANVVGWANASFETPDYFNACAGG